MELWQEYGRVVRLMANTSVPEAVRTEPFNNIADIGSYDWLIHMLIGAPLAVPYGLNLLTPFSGKVYGKIQLGLRILEYVMYLFLGGIGLWIVLWARNGGTSGNFVDLVMQTTVVRGWLTIALLFISCGIAGVGYSAEFSHHYYYRAVIAQNQIFIGLVLLVLGILTVDQAKTAVMHVFAGLLFVISSVMAMTSTHLIVLGGLEKTLKAIPGADSIRKKLSRHVDEAAKKPPQDRAAEWFHYACLFTATVLICNSSELEQPYAYLMRVRHKAVDGLWWFFWVVIILEFTVMVCFLSVGRFFLGLWRKRKGYKRVSQEERQRWESRTGGKEKRKKEKESPAEEESEEEDDDEEDDE